jgi:hypothetical protein
VRAIAPFGRGKNASAGLSDMVGGVDSGLTTRLWAAFPAKQGITGNFAKFGAREWVSARSKPSQNRQIKLVCALIGKKLSGNFILGIREVSSREQGACTLMLDSTRKF